MAHVCSSFLLLFIFKIVSHHVTDANGDPVYIFRYLTLELIRIQTNFVKEETDGTTELRPPNLFVVVNAIQRNMNGRTGRNISLGKSKIVKGTNTPEFNQKFFYERERGLPYTIGTDNILRLNLFDQMSQTDIQDTDLGYYDVPLAAVVSEDASGIELVGEIENETANSSIVYKVEYEIDPTATRNQASLMDNDFSFDTDSGGQRRDKPFIAPRLDYL